MADKKNTILHLMNDLEAARVKFLNQKAIMMYLFGRPYLHCKNMTRVVERYKDRQPLTIDRTHTDDVNTALIQLSHHSFVYRDQYLRHPSSRALIPLNRSDQIEKIAAILDELRMDYALNVSFQAFDTSPAERGYQLDLTIIVDFLGVIVLKTGDSPFVRGLVLFGIIYDRQGTEHHLDSYMAQYHLRQMGVHLLRLSHRVNYRVVVEEFVNRLVLTDQYVAVNPLAPIRGESKEVSERFSLFEAAYRRNHLITKSYQLLTEELSPEEIEQDPGQGSDITEDVFERITGKSFIATKGKKTSTTDDFLDRFLSSYKPAKLDMSCYLRFDVLDGYQLLNDKRQMNEFVLRRTHLMMVNVEKAVIGGKCKRSSIEDGGILVKGGKLAKGKLLSRGLEASDWTHLELETSIQKKTGEIKRFYRYFIRINHYHLFYRTYENQEYQVELA